MIEVKWIQIALNELATAWTDAEPDLRKRINAATKAIDRELREDPHDKGESRPDGSRIFIEMPLGISFRVDQKKAEVEVGHVWLIRPRKES